MELKKSQNADVNKSRIDFRLGGLALVMLTVFSLFAFKVFDPAEWDLDNEVLEEEIIVMENTVQEKKPPPPPPPPELEVVDDEEEIEEEQPEIEENEAEQDDEIEEYEESEEEEEPEDTDEVLEIFEVSEQAQFAGGEDALQRFLAENLEFPPAAQENEIAGRVMVQFVVDKKGKVVDIAVLGKKKGFGLEEEAMRVIKMTSGMWTPASQRDRPVKMRYRVPVNFTLY